MRATTIGAMVLGLVLLALGCDQAMGGSDTPESLPPTGARTDPMERRLTGTARVESMPVQTKVRPTAVSDTIEIENYRGGGGGGSARRPPGMPRGRIMTAEEAQDAARAARSREARPGSEPCELAFQALADVGREYREKTPGGAYHALDHDRFIEDCELRPEPMQWCMVPSYIAQHSEECDREAHTRYQRAIDRAGGADEGFYETGEVAPPAPPGPRRLDGDGATEGETTLGNEEAACPDGNCGE